MYLGGLDVGSGGCKVTVCDDSGNYIESHYEPYEAEHTGGTHTLDAGLILKAVEKVISSVSVSLEALGVTSFGESFVLLDENDRILNRTMLYDDPRGDEESRTFDRDRVESVCCCTPAAMYTLPKLMWMRLHQPEIVEKTSKILLMSDFVVYFLTGSRVISYSSAARTMGFDVRKKTWDRDLFAHAGIDISLMSEPVPDGTVAGVSDRFGLSGTKIIITMHDQSAAAIGAGALRAGDAVDGSGSVECFTPIMSALPENRKCMRAGASFLPYTGGLFAGCAFSYTGGSALRWFRDGFAPGESYSSLDASVGEDPGNILFLPHLAGAATPYMDLDSKSLVWGMTLSSTKADLYRALMEGVAYEFRINMDMMSEGGVHPSRILVTGGGGRSRVWNRIKADITGLPLTAIDVPEVGAAGVIMICARSMGLVKTLTEAADIFSREGETFVPDPARKAFYDEMYEKYKRMYPLTLELRKKEA